MPARLLAPDSELSLWKRLLLQLLGHNRGAFNVIKDRSRLCGKFIQIEGIKFAALIISRAGCPALRNLPGPQQSSWLSDLRVRDSCGSEQR